MPCSPDPGALRIRADLLAVRELAAHLRDACTKARVAELTAFELELALVEAANNIVEHGYLGTSLDQQATIELVIACEEGQLRLTLIDSGKPLPDGFFEGAALPGEDATCGRGAAIIEACTDGLSYQSRDGRNELVLLKTFVPDD